MVRILSRLKGIEEKLMSFKDAQKIKPGDKIILNPAALDYYPKIIKEYNLEPKKEYTVKHIEVEDERSILITLNGYENTGSIIHELFLVVNNNKNTKSTYNNNSKKETIEKILSRV